MSNNFYRFLRILLLTKCFLFTNVLPGSHDNNFYIFYSTKKEKKDLVLFEGHKLAKPFTELELKKYSQTIKSMPLLSITK